MSSPGHTSVIALGGNAIARAGDDGSYEAQCGRARTAMASVADVVLSGERVVLTHGNGPVVGNIVLRNELAGTAVPPMPLFIAGADSEGGIGLMLQQVLGNELRARGSAAVPATVVTQVVVDPADPAFTAPTKPIGPHYSARQADELSATRGWNLAEQPGGTWRRVVASPHPQRIVEIAAVTALLDAGIVPIAAGGGGVPVSQAPDGSLSGCEAVIDKDWTTAVLAHELGADTLVIAMEADAVYHGWGTTSQRAIRHLSAREAAQRAHNLSAGGMEPKLAAAAWFAAQGGTAVIGSSDDLLRLVSQDTGTVVSG